MLTSDAMLKIDDSLKELVDKTAIDEEKIIQNVVDKLSNVESAE